MSGGRGFPARPDAELEGNVRPEARVLHRLHLGGQGDIYSYKMRQKTFRFKCGLFSVFSVGPDLLLGVPVHVHVQHQPGQEGDQERKKTEFGWSRLSMESMVVSTRLGG